MIAQSLADLQRTSPSLSELLSHAARAAATDAPVLILGESGTGRSTLARAFHRASPRSGNALVEVDPGNIPSSLFESEFFGHRRGAFTGAERAYEGKVARARGGTLVLDHVEELPLGSQPKLLRLLAERRFAPLGGGEELQADVRFVAIAPEDLPKRVERGAFRQDLYYRLAVLTFRLPPLRERRDDLSPLIDHLVADLGERFGRADLSLTAVAREWMLDYPWPGNLREMRNLLEQCVILSRGESLDPRPPDDWGEKPPQPLVEVEKEQIRRALAYTRGHQGRAAELLGISRKALWEKRKRYGIP